MAQKTRLRAPSVNTSHAILPRYWHICFVTQKKEIYIVIVYAPLRIITALFSLDVAAFLKYDP